MYGSNDYPLARSGGGSIQVSRQEYQQLAQQVAESQARMLAITRTHTSAGQHISDVYAHSQFTMWSTLAGCHFLVQVAAAQGLATPQVMAEVDRMTIDYLQSLMSINRSAAAEILAAARRGSSEW